MATQEATRTATSPSRPTSTAVRPDDGDQPGSALTGAGVGRNELGTITVGDAVVSKLAARAAIEVGDVGAAAPRVLGRAVSGVGLDKIGVRSSELGALPASSATVDGSLAYVSLTLSVRYPASVREVAQKVRQHVQQRVGAMTGLDVVEVDIDVPALLGKAPRPARVD